MDNLILDILQKYSKCKLNKQRIMKDKLLACLAEVLEVEDRELNLCDEFRSYPEWDSLARLSVVAMLDEEFDVIIEDSTFNKLITIEDLLNEIKK